MQQLEEKKYQVQEYEVELLELLRIVLSYRKIICFVTLFITIVILFGGYLSNRNKIVNSVVISINYASIKEEKNSNELIPIKVIDKVFFKYKDEIKQKDNLGFKNSITIKEIASNRYEISTNNNPTVLKGLIQSTIDNFIAEHKYNFIIHSISNINVYDYEKTENILNDKIDSLRKICEEAEKSNFVSGELKNSFTQVMKELNMLQNNELESIESYISLNGFTTNKKDKEIKYNKDLKDLTLKKEDLMWKVQLIKQVLEISKPSEKSIVILNAESSKDKVDLVNDYYSKLIEDYITINEQIRNIEFEIKRLEKAKLLIKEPTLEEKRQINENLDIVAEKTNKIIEKFNVINKEYNDIKYANMIKVDSPVVTINNGKSYYVFLFGGFMLGFFFSLFIVFILEVKKEYQKKYSK